MITPSVLARANEIVRPALRKAIGSLDPHLRAAAEYHFGWADPDGAPIAVLGAEAAGGHGNDAIWGAVALELVHNFSLIHDDIIDDDRTRRHRRTVWDVYGVGHAIIVGDALHTLAFEVLLAEGDVAHLAAARRLAAATAAMIAGQAHDMALDQRLDVTLTDCLTMEAHKTGALLAQSVAIGAVLAGADASVTACLERYGSELGIAFQAIDDVLGIWGDPAITGKPAGSDLRERKKSMPVAIALGAGGDLADEIGDAFSDDLDDEGIDKLARHLESAGTRDAVEALARDHLASALAALDECELEPSARAELVDLARFVVDRTY